jgi:hypothetical protein
MPHDPGIIIAIVLVVALIILGAAAKHQFDK